MSRENRPGGVRTGAVAVRALLVLGRCCTLNGGNVILCATPLDVRLHVRFAWNDDNGQTNSGSRHGRHERDGVTRWQKANGESEMLR